MGKKEGQSGPPGRRRPQRERRPGRAGSQPPPIYRPTRRGGGTTHTPGTPTRDGGCCSMVAALRSVRRRKWRLAARYARMTVRLLAARVV